MKELTLGGTTTISSVLIHALNNIGKTHLLGSALTYEKQFGPCLYIATAGEAIGTMLSFDLSGIRCVEIDAVSDVTDLCKGLDYQHCIALDSVQRLNELAEYEITKGAYPIGSKEDHGKDWAKLKKGTFNPIELLKKKCSLFLAVCPSNLHMNPITGINRIAPDAPGCGEKLVGRFNFCGYLEATPLTATKTTREITFHTRTDAVTRWNAPKPITAPIKVPDGADGWQAIRKVLDAAVGG